jgi:toxin ParE1/3/4
LTRGAACPTKTPNGESSVAEIVWSPLAIENVQSIERYISDDSPRYARLVVEKLVAVAEQLALFPESGRVVPEFSDPRIREILWRNYRLVYRTSGATVEIVTVFHGARLFRNP